MTIRLETYNAFSLRLLSILVLDRHGFRIDSLLAGYAFQPCEDAAVVVLIALHGEAALFVSVCPNQTDVVFLRFAEGDQCAHAQSEDANSDRRSDPAVNILAIA